jgi:cytosine/adenosine deaminase-related metal-dependent hydrolase
MDTDQLVQWATAGGARLFGLGDVGEIAPGRQADLVLYGLDHPRYAGNHDPVSAPITAGGAARLRHVWVAGREVVRDGAIPGFDLPAWLARADAVVRRLRREAA